MEEQVLKASFDRGDVNLGFRNHGIPYESLCNDITPEGEHYTLIHFDIPYIAADTYILKIKGLFDKELNLTLNDIKSLPKHSVTVTLECAGNGRLLSMHSVPWEYQAVGTAIWSGTSLKNVIQLASLQREAIELLFTGKDNGIQGGEPQYYQRSLPISECLDDDVILAYEMNNKPLPSKHGFPLRLIVPKWYGMTSVKWLDNIEAINYKFEGYQMISYSLDDDKGNPTIRITKKKVRSLMKPPGVPDFGTRARTMLVGKTILSGKAWASGKEICKVEVSLDNGNTWKDAVLFPNYLGKYAWRTWIYSWDADVGEYILCVRATTIDNETQPIALTEFPKFGNNSWQRIVVKVVSPSNMNFTGSSKL